MKREVKKTKVKTKEELLKEKLHKLSADSRNSNLEKSQKFYESGDDEMGDYYAEEARDRSEISPKDIKRKSEVKKRLLKKLSKKK